MYLFQAFILGHPGSPVVKMALPAQEHGFCHWLGRISHAVYGGKKKKKKKIPKQITMQLITKVNKCEMVLKKTLFSVLASNFASIPLYFETNDSPR